MRRSCSLLVVILAAGLCAANGADAVGKGFWASVPYPDGEACAKASTQSPKASPKANFRGAILSGTDFSKADLTGANFSGAVLCDVNFQGAKLAGADFSGARIEKGVFENVSAAGANFSGAVLLSAGLAGANFSGANFSRAMVACNSAMVETDCAPADGLDLSRADLMGAVIVGLGFGVKMAGAKAEGATADIDLVPSFGDANFMRLKLAPMPLSDAEPDAFTRAEIGMLLKTWKTPQEAIAFGPGFDCAKAKAADEIAVCSSADLSASDGVLALMYAKALDASPKRAGKIKAAQRTFLKQRAHCVTGSGHPGICTSEYYRNRIEALLPLTHADTTPIQPGVYRPASYYAWMPKGVAGTELGRRFAALQMPTSDTITVKRDGAYVTADAETLGANGHTCSSDGVVTGMPKEGGYRLAERAGAKADKDGVLLAPFGNILLLKGGDTYCGARARWYPIWQLSR